MKRPVQEEMVQRGSCSPATNPGALDDMARRKGLAPCGPASGVKARKRAFTLVELLVVIAIIAILAAILLPVLDKAKMRAQTTYCVNNMKQLQICYLMYVQDNSDSLPPNGGNPNVSETNSWANLSDAQTDYSPANLQRCAFYQYNNQVKIYACPANTKMIRVPTSPFPLPPYKPNELEPQTRTCQIDYTLNELADGQATGRGGDYIRWKMSQIMPGGKGTPGLAKKVVFVDANEDWVSGGAIGIYGNGDTSDIAQNGFWNPPGNRHSNGATFSFADGHAEAWRWRGLVAYDRNTQSTVCDSLARQYDGPRLSACQFDYNSQP